MIEQIEKRKVEELGTCPIWSQVEAKMLDAQVLDGIEDSSISHLTGTMVYNLLASGRQGLQAGYRVLHPGGVIGMTLGSGSEWMDLVRNQIFFLILKSRDAILSFSTVFSYSILHFIR